MAPLPTVTQSVTTFVTLYSLAGAATAAPAAFTKTNQSKLKLALQRIIVHSRRNVRIALAPVILPIVYRLTQNWYLRRHPDPIDASHKRAIHKFYPKDILPVLVSSPVFLLLPKGFRVQVALYFLSTYCYTFVTLDESNECEEDAQECAKPKSKSFKWRKYVPPIWTLSAAADAWLLWALLFENYSFPEGYGKIIFDVSLLSPSLINVSISDDPKSCIV
ncbi:hypothetical protein FRB99_008538 [Tulasnella sp. 403]|nr:hypothetical protein FRB99_008538 [Tulasnella sp. 403]